MSEEQQVPPVCPMMGVQSVPVRGNVTSIATKQGVQIQDRFHPCMGAACAWWIRLGEEGRGVCVLVALSGSIAGWNQVETNE